MPNSRVRLIEIVNGRAVMGLAIDRSQVAAVLAEWIASNSPMAPDAPAVQSLVSHALAQGEVVLPTRTIRVEAMDA